MSIKYGNVDLLDEDECDPENSTIAVTFRMPLDLYQALKKEAATRGVDPATAANQLLRNALCSGDHHE